MNFPTNLNALTPSTGASVTASPKSSKIHDAAQQFEALMLGEMLKSARESGSWNLSDGDADPGQDSLAGMAESQFAMALAKSGGLGLSHMVEQGVSKQAGPQKENTSPRLDSPSSAK